MNKIQIKFRLIDSVLFEYERENNSMKLTLEAAVKSGADLYGAYLRSAYLYGADLYGAYLNGANLYGANLRSAYLNGANLNGAYLRSADLYGANLNGANLYGANLNGAYLCSAIIADGFICDGKFHHITNVGSEKGTLELYSCGKSGWYIKRGCFCGSKQEFLNAVDEIHGDNEHGKKYRSIIEFFCGE